VTIVKLAVGLAILAYLIIKGRDAFAQLSKQTIHWPTLGLALVATLLTATLSFVRWHILVLAVGINVRLVDSLRLGALGFALNFISPGSIGGDFFKAIFLAHGQPKQRTEAIASVVADRVMGLLTLLLIASVGILITGLLHTPSESLRVLCRLILICTVALWIGSILLLYGGQLTGNWFRDRAHHIPIVGKTIVRLLHAVEAYRNQLPMLAAAFGVSIAMAMCYTTSFYLVARGLPLKEPSWSEHLVIVPCAALVGALPLTPSGLGTTEFALDELYKAMPGGIGIVTGDGTLVGLGRRVTDIAVALVGLVFYLSHRREVSEVYAEAEELAEKEDAE
jgi:uncharacterized protein (TIRG00374 family)